MEYENVIENVTKFIEYLVDINLYLLLNIPSSYDIVVFVEFCYSIL